MSCDPGEPEYRMHQYGALPPELVAGISGIEPEQLECWRVEGLLPATLSKAELEPFCDEDDPDWFYTLDDHARVLAAAKLLQLGLPEAELPAALARLDEACVRWAVDLPPLQISEAFPAGLDHERFIAERKHEDRLGRFYRYADVVEMVDEIRDGMPNIRGSRIDTYTMICSYRSDSDIEWIARGHCLTPYQVRRAVRFEQAVRGLETADATAAG